MTTFREDSTFRFNLTTETIIIGVPKGCSFQEFLNLLDDAHLEQAREASNKEADYCGAEFRKNGESKIRTCLRPPGHKGRHTDYESSLI